MLATALIALAGGFVLLFVLRVGGARRAMLLARWPAILFAGAALAMLARGSLNAAVFFAAAAGIAWVLWPRFNTRQRNQQPALDRGDAEACALLGVSIDASADDIRSAYRAKMARAHPDRGGGHAEAARLTAARDRLLRKRR